MLTRNRKYLNSKILSSMFSISISFGFFLFFPNFFGREIFFFFQREGRILLIMNRDFKSYYHEEVTNVDFICLPIQLFNPILAVFTLYAQLRKELLFNFLCYNLDAKSLIRIFRDIIFLFISLLYVFVCF